MQDMDSIDFCEKPWGSFFVIHRGQDIRVKVLKVKPGNRLSDQRHTHRSEHWFVASGFGAVELEYPNGTKEKKELGPDDTVTFERGVWHRLSVPSHKNEELHVVEIWKGDKLSEHDIERRSDDYGRT